MLLIIPQACMPNPNLRGKLMEGTHDWTDVQSHGHRTVSAACRSPTLTCHLISTSACPHPAHLETREELQLLHVIGNVFTLGTFSEMQKLLAHLRSDLLPALQLFFGQCTGTCTLLSSPFSHQPTRLRECTLNHTAVSQHISIQLKIAGKHEQYLSINSQRSATL